MTDHKEEEMRRQKVNNEESKDDTDNISIIRVKLI